MAAADKQTAGETDNQREQHLRRRATCGTTEAADDCALAFTADEWRRPPEARLATRIVLTAYESGWYYEDSAQGCAVGRLGCRCQTLEAHSSDNKEHGSVQEPRIQDGMRDEEKRRMANRLLERDVGICSMSLILFLAAALVVVLALVPPWFAVRPGETPCCPLSDER